MAPSLRAFLSGLIDYAGLFPPAQLLMEQAIRNYLGYRNGPDAWMLGRFVCPGERLAEASPYLESVGDDWPVPFSVLGRGRYAFADEQDIAAFRQRHGDRVRIDGFEIKWSHGLQLDPIQLLSAISEAKSVTGSGAMFFVEIPPEEDRDDRLRALIQGIKFVDQDTPCPCGLKMRCGGLESSAYPPAERVAFVIATCRDLGVAFKCTAGLHHPVRHFDSSLRARMHGFVNVFGAAILAHACGLAEGTIRQIILEEDPGRFAFEPNSFRWKDHRATTAEIEAARRTFCISFGSCSFDEPREDLRALGWLE
jgi:hypothetical protein